VGSFSGTFSLFDNGDRPIVGSTRPRAPSRTKIPYSGLIIPDPAVPGMADGMGSFVLQGVTASQAKKSGRVTLEPLSLPTATAAPATAVLLDSVTLNGVVNAAGAITTVTFEYGDTPQAEFLTPISAIESPLPANAVALPVSVNLAPSSSLIPHQRYYYRIKVENANGITYSSYAEFTPGVTALPTDSITSTGATMHGAVDPNNELSSVFMDYGLTTTYGKSTATNPPTVTTAGQTPVAAAVIGLVPNTLYHYRVRVSGPFSTYFSEDMTFTTAP
jgi:hypothetical protein